MSFLGVLEAVRARLAGADPLFVPAYPSLESLTKRLTEEHPSAPDPPTHVGTSFGTSAVVKTLGVGNGAFSVPVYEFDIQGEYHNLNFPALTYEVIGYSPRYNEFVFNDSDYGGPDLYRGEVIETTETIIDNLDGTVVGDGARMVYQRELAHPFDVLVEVRAYSKDNLISSLLVEWVYRTFPPRGFIRVPKKDGTFRSWDMSFQNFVDADKRKAVIENRGAAREHAKIWTYKVEGYFDNSDTSELVHLVRERTLLQNGGSL